MPLIIFLIILFALMFWLDGRLVFRFLYFAVNLWLMVMYLAITELQTVNLPQAPWFETVPVSDTVKIYLAILLCAGGSIFYLLSHALSLSKIASFFPILIAVELLISTFLPNTENESIVFALFTMLLLIAHIVCFALNSRNLLHK